MRHYCSTVTAYQLSVCINVKIMDAHAGSCAQWNSVKTETVISKQSYNEMEHKLFFIFRYYFIMLMHALFINSANSLKKVTLNSTLYLGEYARPGQRVTFTCEARDTSILEWHSDKYIGPGGDHIQILRNGDGSNQTRFGGKTVATTVSINTYSGVTVIVSQLHIMTSVQILTSSVMCAVNGQGPRKVISFATTGMKNHYSV